MTVLSSLVRPTLERPREENEADLVAIIHEMLVNAGVVALVDIWTADPIISPQLHENSNLQQYAIARYFNLKLLEADAANTLNTRTILNLTCDGVEFVENFRNHVLPTIVRYYGQ